MAKKHTRRHNSGRSKRVQDRQPPAERQPMYETMRRFIRAHCDDYLADPNITSIGIAYKNPSGNGRPEQLERGKRAPKKPARELVLQFSVARKVAPEALESVSTKLIPKEIEFEGLRIPTDVVQRSFRPGYRLIASAELEKDPRKQRLETLAPGI